MRAQASRYEFDWKKSLDTRYDKLQATERKYDPESLFIPPSSSFTKTLDQTSGTQVPFVESETAPDPHIWNRATRPSSTAVHNPRDSITITLTSLI